MPKFRHLLPLLALALTAIGTNVRAHTPSETYLTLFVTPAAVTGQWDVAIRDLQHGLKLDEARAPAVPVDVLERQLEALAIDTVTRLEVKIDGRPLPFRVTDLETVTLNAGDYARVRFAAALSNAPAVLEIQARALFAVDTNMHGLLRVEHDGRTETASFNIASASWRIPLSEKGARGKQTWTFVREGVGHIWQGPDHILFLLALLLPAVLRRTNGKGEWSGAASFRPAFLGILKIVTAFTLAHSITLSLAVLGVVRVPGRVVEPLIAASVIAAAANNLRPWFGGRGWMVAFAFGLIHGFGLATGLLEFGLRRETLALALVGFNVGVECGQLAIVAVFLPVAFALRETWFYRRLTFRFGSAAVLLVAAVWMAERLFDFKLLPF